MVNVVVFSRSNKDDHYNYLISHSAWSIAISLTVSIGTFLVGHGTLSHLVMVNATSMTKAFASSPL